MVKESGESLDEIVVTGVSAGTSTKKLGFVVEKVSFDEGNSVPTVDVASALAGKVSGVKIVKGSGNPLDNSAIVIRGASSIRGDTKPMIIIDGIQTEAGLNEINMDDVASIEIVKGAAASAMYGSLAGNGVIQIITKKGKSGDAKVTIGTEYGISKINGTYPIATKHDRLVNSDGSIDFDTPDPDGLFDNDYEGKVNDIVGLFVKSQPYIQNSFSISQRVDKLDYYFSAQNSKVDGVLKGISPFTKQNFRLNVGADVNEKFRIGASASYSKTKGVEVRGNDGSQGTNLFYQLLKANPTIDFTETDENGNLKPYFVVGGVEDVNPLYRAKHEKRDRIRNRWLIGFNGNYKFSEAFNLLGAVSMDKLDAKYINFYHKGFVSGSLPDVQKDNGYLRNFNQDVQRVNSSLQLNFSKKFDKFGVKSSLKYLLEDYSYSSIDITGYDMIDMEPNFNGVLQENLKTKNYFEDTKTQNYFLSADFDWDDKIILSGVVRTDRSSLFGSDHRDQVFYRGSLAYRLSEDIDFEWLDELKFRASYGVAGLRPDFGDSTVVYSIDANTHAYQPKQYGNPDLHSPIISEMEFGFDFDFLHNYKFGFTYANSDTTDAIMKKYFSAAVSEFEYTYVNTGNTNYKAYELSLSGTPYKNDNFSWNFGLTWSKISNTYGKLGVPAYMRDIDTNSTVFRVEEGMPYGALYGAQLATSLDQLTVVDGLVINHGLNLPIEDFKINRYGYVIVAANEGVNNSLANGGEQAILQWDEESNQEKVGLIGDTTPDFNMGINNTLKYKNFTLYSLIDIQKGGDVYNKTKQQMYYQGRHLDQQNFGAEGQPTMYSGPASTLYGSGAAIDYFVEDGSFMKLRELSLSYLIDKKMFGKAPIDNVMISFSGRNLLTITNYSGWDPEVSANNSPIFRLDEFAYPNFSTYSASIKVTF